MIGKTISHYKILEKLGEGGMGVVYRAEDAKLKRTVALKFLTPQALGTEEEKTRFVHEAQAAAALSHPHIATVYEIDEVESETFIAMEYIEGESISEKIKSGPLKLEDALDIGIQAAEGLQEAHEKGIVHRDIKSANIMMTEKGQAKIMDFGLAKSSGQTKLTKTGTTLGTVSYMSPEQARGVEVDHRTDLWSLGVVLYEMVTGQLPFKGDYEQAVMYSILNETPDPMTGLRTGVPIELERITSKALSKSPDERYQHVDEIKADLKKLKKDLETGKATTITFAIPVPKAEGKKPAWRLPAFIVAGAIMGVLLTFGIRSLMKRSTEPVATLEENSLAVLYFENLMDPEDSDRLGQILQELVIADLSGMASLKVFSSQRLFDIQKQLGSRDRRKIDPELATEVAKQAGAETMLTGTLSQLGGMRILTSQLIDVIRGTVIKSQRIDGTDLYVMVDDLANEVRYDLDLPEAEGDRLELAVSEKTTSSMEAYQHYLEGVDLLNKSEFDSAAVEFQKAVSIDSTFNQAYYKMAIAQWWGSATNKQATESLSHILSRGQEIPRRVRLLAEGALALINDRATEGASILQELVRDYPDEKEGWYGLGEVFFHGYGDNLKALDAFQRAIQLDPEFKLAYVHIYDIYINSEMFDRGIELAKHYTDLYPDEALGYGELALMYRAKGQFDLALESYHKGLSLDPEAYSLISGMGHTYQLMGDYDRAIQLYGRLADPQMPLNWQETGRNWISRLYAEQGKFREALKDMSETHTISESIGKDNQADILIWQAWFSHVLGDTTIALELLDSALNLNPDFGYVLLAYYFQGAIYARWGQLEALSAVIDTVRRIIEREGITSWGKFAYNALLVERFELIGELERALMEFENLEDEKVWRDYFLYKRALLQLARKNYDQALAITHQMQEPSLHRNPRYLVYPMGFYVRGRVYEEMRELALARENYEKLLSLWEDGDEEIPERKDAIMRLSRIIKLQG